jgi:hypothetical protein
MPNRLLTLAFIASLTLGAAAQTPPPTVPPRGQQPTPQRPPQAPPATIPTPVAEQTPPRAERTPEAPGQPVNVRLDLTITDQTGPGDPTRKTVTMLLSDRQPGSIRSRGQARVSGRWENVTINVDARPVILREGSIRVEFGLEYQPRGAGDPPSAPGGGAPSNMPPLEPASSNLNQRLSVILDSGKPLVISQAADPASDRRISVELKATVLK